MNMAPMLTSHSQFISGGRFNQNRFEQNKFLINEKHKPVLYKSQTEYIFFSLVEYSGAEKES